MPLAFSVQEPRTFMVRASGRVTYEEVEQIRASILADPHLSRGARMLVDGRAVSAAPTASELRTIATEMLPMLQRGLGPVAIVTSSPMVYGVARMFSVFAELVSANVAPFPCMDDAEKWLASQSAPLN